jgi:magnesium transporter
MEELFHRRSVRIGQAPGNLNHMGPARAEPVRITLVDYNAERIDEREVTTIEECYECMSASSVTWVNIDGVHEPSVLAKIGEKLNLHQLLLEDVAHTDQRPKLEDFDDRLYIVMRMLSVSRVEDNDEVEEFRVASEQISLVLGTNFVLTFQEDPVDVFEPVRRRLRENKGKIRKMGPDYLTYALLDVVVDNYFTVLELFGDQAEELEEEVMENPTSETLRDVQHMKRALIQMRRAVWPLRDVLNVMIRGDSKLIRKATIVFLRDVYDHTIRVVDIMESFREMVGGLLDIYLSTVSNRMNEVMKVLTIMATIFIPLTFIAGIYGMNFDNMPELHWPWGYWYVWGIMMAVGMVMLLYFRRKRWF